MIRVAVQRGPVTTTIIERNTVTDNSEHGIFFESSYTAKIRYRADPDLHQLEQSLRAQYVLPRRKFESLAWADKYIYDSQWQVYGNDETARFTIF